MKAQTATNIIDRESASVNYSESASTEMQIHIHLFIAVGWKRARVRAQAVLYIIQTNTWVTDSSVLKLKFVIALPDILATFKGPTLMVTRRESYCITHNSHNLRNILGLSCKFPLCTTNYGRRRSRTAKIILQPRTYPFNHYISQT